MILRCFALCELIVEIAEHKGAILLAISNFILDFCAVFLSDFGRPFRVCAHDVNAYESHQVLILR